MSQPTRIFLGIVPLTSAVSSSVCKFCREEIVRIKGSGASEEIARSPTTIPYCSCKRTPFTLREHTPPNAWYLPSKPCSQAAHLVRLWPAAVLYLPLSHPLVIHCCTNRGKRGTHCIAESSHLCSRRYRICVSPLLAHSHKGKGHFCSLGCTAFTSTALSFFVF